MQKLLNEEHFYQLLPSETLIVDFWAPWCKPCKPVERILTELEKNYPNAVFVSINVEECRRIPAQYGVRGLPTIIAFKNGKVFDALSGNLGREKIEEFIKRAAG